MDKKIDALLEFDPLQYVEDVTGDHYNNHPGLAMIVAQAHGAAKEAALVARGDSVYSDSISRYLWILGGLGFTEAKVHTFTWMDEYADGKLLETDALHLMVHQKHGLLLLFDTFRGRVNSATCYFNWESYTDDHWALRCSGGLCRDETKHVFVGYFDAREGVVFRVKHLLETGRFVTPWVERPFLWLLHHRDTKDGEYNYHAINEERLGWLPAAFIEQMGPER